MVVGRVSAGASGPRRDGRDRAVVLPQPWTQPAAAGPWGGHCIRGGLYGLDVDILDLLSLSGRLLPRLTRLVVVVGLLFFPTVAAGIVLQAGREEGARFSATVHRLLQRDLKLASGQRPGRSTSN
jgi:hypothetical protein